MLVVISNTTITTTTTAIETVMVASATTTTTTTTAAFDSGSTGLAVIVGVHQKLYFLTTMMTSNVEKQYLRVLIILEEAIYLIVVPE